VTAFPTWTPGEIVTATKLGLYTTNVTAICQVRMTAQSITDNTLTALLFDTDTTGTEDLDTLGWHENTVAPERITPTIAGWYQVGWSCEWQTDTDYVRVFSELQKNEAVLSPARRIEGPVATAPHHYTGGGLVQMNGTTDRFRITVFQDNTSGNANTVSAVFTVELKIPT
jgi:hypothetical protein